MKIEMNENEVKFMNEVMELARQRNINVCLVTPTTGVKINSYNKEFNLDYIIDGLMNYSNQDINNVKDIYMNITGTKNITFADLFLYIDQCDVNMEGFKLLFCNNTEGFPKWVIEVSDDRLRCILYKATNDMVNLKKIVSFSFFNRTKVTIRSHKVDNQGEYLEFNTDQHISDISDVMWFNLIGDEGTELKTLLGDILLNRIS